MRETELAEGARCVTSVGERWALPARPLLLLCHSLALFVLADPVRARLSGRRWLSVRKSEAVAAMMREVEKRGELGVPCSANAGSPLRFY
jgi:hypothetical protein